MPGGGSLGGRSFNDQPWSWIIARRQDSEAFEKMLGCLLEANQGWAKQAGALLLSVRNPKRVNRNSVI